MSLYLSPRSRPLRICAVPDDHRIINQTLEQIETQIHRVHPFEMYQPRSLRSLDPQDFDLCDLLLLMAHRLEGQDLLDWIKSFMVLMSEGDRIWIPALIVGQMEFEYTQHLIEIAARSNWYFDFVCIEHMSSLSLRIANLIRICDHLRELYRYEGVLSDLEKKTHDQKRQIHALNAKIHGG